MNNKLREQYCLEKGGINPSNIIEWYYIEWLEYKLTEALKQSDEREIKFPRVMQHFREFEKWCKENKRPLRSYHNFMHFREFIDYQLREQALKQSDNSELLRACRVIYDMWEDNQIAVQTESKADYYAIDRLFNHLNQNNER